MGQKVKSDIEERLFNTILRLIPQKICVVCGQSEEEGQEEVQRVLGTSSYAHGSCVALSAQQFPDNQALLRTHQQLNGHSSALRYEGENFSAAGMHVICPTTSES